MYIVGCIATKLWPNFRDGYSTNPCLFYFKECRSGVREPVLRDLT